MYAEELQRSSVIFLNVSSMLTVNVLSLFPPSMYCKSVSKFYAYPSSEPRLSEFQNWEVNTSLDGILDIENC